MAYVTLGPRPVVAKADSTGQNTGNYTAVFDQTVMSINVPEFELYHMFITAPTLTGQSTTAQIKLNQAFWDATLIGQLNSWDPSQPMILTPGDTISILFNVPTTNATAPTVTCWFRYNNI